MKLHMDFKNSAAVIGLLVALDQFSKYWMLEKIFGLPYAANDFMARAMPIEVTSFWNWVTVWNRGVSFGLFRGADWFPVAITIATTAIIAGLFYWLSREKDSFFRLALSMILGGAIGNLIDRFRFGAVFDFINWHWQNWHWPAFNLADSVITIGVVFLLYHWYIRPKRDS